MDLLDLFERGTDWTASKVPAAADQLGKTTPCDQWDVRAVLNHVIDTQHYFAATARGEKASMNPTPPDLIGQDPVASYDKARTETLRAFREPGVIEKTGPSLGIAFVDQLVHGWDIARATGQDTTMPDGLADSALQMIDGQLTDDRRGDAFKPAVEATDSASPQDRLLAYTGRRP